MKDLDSLFEETLRDIYYAEKQIARTLPLMSRKANNPELIKAFERHEIETHEHISRLEQIFDYLGKAPRAKTCPAIDGIINEAKELIQDANSNAVRNAGLIAAAQAVEHYEIARYGTLCAWAKQLDMPQVVKILHKTLDEEKHTNNLLSQLADHGGINHSAQAA